MTANETVSVIVVVQRCRPKEAPQSHIPKTIQKGPNSTYSGNNELLSAKCV